MTRYLKSVDRRILSLVLGLVLIWFVVLWGLPNSKAVVADYAAFTFLGVIGAIFANATGAGGGVVFIPAFEQLEFTHSQAIATSFAIQCMGMTSGSIAWSRFQACQSSANSTYDWGLFWPIIGFVSTFSIAGIWLAYAGNWHAPASLTLSFAWFSLILGAAICASSIWLPNRNGEAELHWWDWLAMAVIGLVGGVITAWLSVGVGEILAIYLILRRFQVTLAVACAVVISALTVWSGLPQHAWLKPQVYWQVVLFAGPGAIFGAILARKLATRLPVRQLKLFFGLWVLIMGAASLANAAAH
ncbi:sulfite exporter TauE/SafE family protein [Paraferrimonas sedimenticola]|uniref:Probable membrane transporter protein n=1 Tax=Paraferrimonas sedimenticola TaxID=375674 RepID=A0AA37RU59_9GAMM|nr:sulfite exporter TauE/SafE family protein [Paraferrimonas sedimenticola]GLP95012.1 hypothetical protein GCM10007895_03180 [Paraferrimonas sedimenticola]